MLPVDEMRIFVFGASGLAGSYMCRAFAGKGNTVVTASGSNRGMDYSIDASDSGAISRALSKEKPDLVINAVKSSTSTDASEELQAETWAANVALPACLARLQPKLGYLLFHMSSDWVYEGKEGISYSEESLTYPLNFYAYTKAVAEERVRLLSSRHIIARATGIFGADPRGRDFFSRFLSATKSGAVFPAAADQYSQPIFAGELARLAKRLVAGGHAGTYNCVGPDYVSRYELALMFAESFGHKELVKKAASSSRKIRVPSHLRLDISKISKVCEVHGLAKQIESLKIEMEGAEKTA